MKMRHLLPAVTLAAALVAVPAYAYGPSIDNPYASETGVPLTVHVDGKYVSTDVDPYLKAGRTYLPLRAAAESMGAAVEWDGATRSITVTKDSTVIRCSVGSAAFTVNGTTRYSDAAPEIRDGRTMLPIRPIAEALGGSLEWDGYTASVTIDTPAADASAPTLPNDIPSEVRWLVEKYYVPADGQGNGSWQCVVPEDQHRLALRYSHNYLFVSEMANGTKSAVMVGYMNGGYPSIGADRMDVVTTEGKLQLKDNWSPHYWHGAGINSSASMYFLVDYDYDGDNLHLSGAMAKNSYPTPGWKDSYYNLDATFVPFGETASVEPEEPTEPFSALAYERYPGDENAPDWMVAVDLVKVDSPEEEAYFNGDESGALTVYVTKPADMTSEQWETLKEYYSDKPRPTCLWPDEGNWTFLETPLISSYAPVYLYRDSDDLTTNFAQDVYDRQIWDLYKNMENGTPEGGNIICSVPHVPDSLRYEPYPGDENAPDWMVEIVEEVDFCYWKKVYVTKPYDMTDEVWEEIKNYYQYKERPKLYPTHSDGYMLVAPSLLDTTNWTQEYMYKYLHDLYNTMMNEIYNPGSGNGSYVIFPEPGSDYKGEMLY